MLDNNVVKNLKDSLTIIEFRSLEKQGFSPDSSREFAERMVPVVASIISEPQMKNALNELLKYLKRAAPVKLRDWLVGIIRSAEKEELVTGLQNFKKWVAFKKLQGKEIEIKGSKISNLSVKDYEMMLKTQAISKLLAAPASLWEQLKMVLLNDIQDLIENPNEYLRRHLDSLHAGIHGMQANISAKFEGDGAIGWKLSSLSRVTVAAAEVQLKWENQMKNDAIDNLFAGGVTGGIKEYDREHIQSKLRSGGQNYKLVENIGRIFTALNDIVGKKLLEDLLDLDFRDKLASFINHATYNDYADELRKKNAIKRKTLEVPYNQKSKDPDLSDGEYLDQLTSERLMEKHRLYVEQIEYKVTLEMIANNSVFSPRERQLLELQIKSSRDYNQLLTQEELADKMGIKKNNVKQIMYTASRKIRKLYPGLLD